MEALGLGEYSAAEASCRNAHARGRRAAERCAGKAAGAGGADLAGGCDKLLRLLPLRNLEGLRPKPVYNADARQGRLADVWGARARVRPPGQRGGCENRLER